MDEVLKVQTKREIQAYLQQLGTRPERRLGQNFLVDGNLMRKLVQSAEISAGDTVWEVGGGTGGLTDLLARCAQRLLVVEIQAPLAEALVERFAAQPHVQIIHGDVLDGKHAIAAPVLAALHAARPSTGQCLLVANLPYSAATPLIMNILIDEPLVARLCFTIQKEVGQRITARAGCRDFGPLSILAQTLGTVRRIAVVPASAFWPAPQVDSWMLRLDRRPHPFPSDAHLLGFIGLLKAAFSHRRKTLRYNLPRLLDESGMAIAAQRLNLSQRAEAIATDTWVQVGLELGLTAGKGVGGRGVGIL